MSKHHLAVRPLLALVVIVGAACDSGPAPEAALEPDERALVELYVRLTLFEALYAQSPDSVNASLDSLQARFDSAAVQRALDALASDPLRYEQILDVIARTLSELEKDPTRWWSLATADSSLAVPAAADPTASEPAPDR